MNSPDYSLYMDHFVQLKDILTLCTLTSTFRYIFPHFNRWHCSKASAGYDSIAERQAVNLISRYMDFLRPENIFDDHFTECQLGQQRGLVRAENNR